MIENIKRDFLRFGFLRSPLSNNEIETLESMGFSADDIFEIGCDMQQGEFATIEEAAEWYEIGKGN